MRAKAVVLAMALTLTTPAVGYAGTSWTPRPATFGVVKQQNVPIRMDDGTVLEADILRPASPDGSPAPGRFPVLLTQTPYNKQSPQLNFENDYLVQRGYIQAIVDVRGTGSSEGQWSSFGPREQQDYCATAAWAAQLPGSTGDIGLYGISYGAIDQIYTAACHPPGLKAMFPIVPMGDAYRDVTVSGGQADTGFIPSWLGLVTGAGLVPASAATDPTEAGTALLGHAAGAITFQSPTVASTLSGRQVDGVDGAFDGSFYQQRSPLNVIEGVDVPTFVVGGEYDLFQRGEPLLYNALRARGVPARLLIGPWTHLAASMGSGLPADGVPSLQNLELRWFDRYLKGIPDPTLDRDVPPVTAWRIGTGRYERHSAYPPADTKYTELPLGGSAAPGSPGALGTSAPGTGTVPYVPVAGLCTESTAQWTAGAAPTGLPLCTGNHAVNDNLGVAYDLPVTGTSLRIAGTSMARLFVSTTRRDAFVTARLEDVSPNGKSTPLSNGWQVLSLRAVDPGRSTFRNGLMIQPWHPDTRASVELVQPGTIYELDVEIFPTFARIPSGHSLRLALQTADEPHATPPLPQAAAGTGGVLTVYADPNHPSALIFGKES